MTALIVVAAVVAYLVGYFAFGWYLAKQDLPNAWARARMEWSSALNIRDSVREQTTSMVFFWPLLFPMRAIRAGFIAVVDSSDPRERERDLARREREIARLERELGIHS